jgi:hypothetical protein
MEIEAHPRFSDVARHVRNLRSADVAGGRDVLAALRKGPAIVSIRTFLMWGPTFAICAVLVYLALRGWW